MTEEQKPVEYWDRTILGDRIRKFTDDERFEFLENLILHRANRPARGMLDTILERREADVELEYNPILYSPPPIPIFEEGPFSFDEPVFSLNGQYRGTCLRQTIDIAM